MPIHGQFDQHARLAQEIPAGLGSLPPSQARRPCKVHRHAAGLVGQGEARPRQLTPHWERQESALGWPRQRRGFLQRCGETTLAVHAHGHGRHGKGSLPGPVEDYDVSQPLRRVGRCHQHLRAPGHAKLAGSRVHRQPFVRRVIRVFQSHPEAIGIANGFEPALAVNRLLLSGELCQQQQEDLAGLQAYGKSQLPLFRQCGCRYPEVAPAERKGNALNRHLVCLRPAGQLQPFQPRRTFSARTDIQGDRVESRELRAGTPGTEIRQRRRWQFPGESDLLELELRLGIQGLEFAGQCGDVGELYGRSTQFCPSRVPAAVSDQFRGRDHGLVIAAFRPGHADQASCNAGSGRSPRSAAFRLQKHGFTLRHGQISTPALRFTLLQPEGCAPGSWRQYQDAPAAGTGSRWSLKFPAGSAQSPHAHD